MKESNLIISEKNTLVSKRKRNKNKKVGNKVEVMMKETQNHKLEEVEPFPAVILNVMMNMATRLLMI